MTHNEDKKKLKAEADAIHAKALAEFFAKGGTVQTLARPAAPPIPTAK